LQSALLPFISVVNKRLKPIHLQEKTFLAKPGYQNTNKSGYQNTMTSGYQNTNKRGY